MIAKNAKCPYYSCETKKYNILCYSDAPPSIKLSRKFPSLTEKIQYRKRYCTGYDYFSCPLFKAVAWHYEIS